MAKTEQHARLMKNYQEWRVEHATGLDSVHDALEAGDYVKACRIMDAVVQHAAQVAVAMRGIMVKEGTDED